jgi:membrane associated rhomboid family serine protease
VRAPDLRRLRHVRAGRHPLPRSRRGAQRSGDASQAASGAPRAGHRARLGDRAGHLCADRDQRRHLPRHGSLYLRWLLFGPFVAHGGWYRLITSMFLHGFLLHIVFNMVALYFIGVPVEQYLGRARYIGLYFVSGLAGAAGALLQAPLAPTVGASGAIFGILGAMMIIEWQITGRLAGQAMTWIVINLVISFSFSGISWGGHLGGLIGGILITLAYAHWGDRGRAQYGQLGLGGVLGLVAVAAGSIVIAYFRVRGYA